MTSSAGRATWGALAFIAIASTIISLNPVRQVTGAVTGYNDPCFGFNNSGNACSDGRACSYNDTCVGNGTAGQCVGIANDTYCDDGNLCTTDECHARYNNNGYSVTSPLTFGGYWDGCSHVPNTLPCNDNNACTVGDECGSSSCQSGTAVNCTAYDTQCATAGCNSTGAEGNCDLLDISTNNNTACDNMGEVKCNVDPALCLNGNCTNAPDMDGDAICDEDEASGRVDAFDPSGYFYDEKTARIIPGGKVAVQCGPPNSWTLNEILNGANGQYKFEIGDPPASAITCTLTITPPLGCAFSKTCLPEASTLDPTGRSNPYALGNYPSGSDPSMLSSNACTDWYTSIALQAGDPEVINNNIPLRCPDVKAPTVSRWGLGAMALLLLAAAFGLLRRNARQA